jgi:hypothetical protein
MRPFLNFMLPGRERPSSRAIEAARPVDLTSFVPASWVPEAGQGPIPDALWPPRCGHAAHLAEREGHPSESPPGPDGPPVFETPDERVVPLFPRPRPESTHGPAEHHDDNDDDDPGPAAA